LAVNDLSPAVTFTSFGIPPLFNSVIPEIGRPIGNCKNAVFCSESSDWTADCNLLCVVPVECHGLGISVILIFSFYRSIAEELKYYFQNLFLFK
jgi:hypothetical protein